MAAPIEQLLKSAKALNAERLVLEAGKSAFVWTQTGVKEITKSMLTPYDIFKLIAPIMPEEKKVALVGQSSTEFAYELEGAGAFNVTVIKENNGIKVFFKSTDHPETPPLIDTQQFAGKQQSPPPTQPFPLKPSAAQQEKRLSPVNAEERGLALANAEEKGLAQVGQSPAPSSPIIKPIAAKPASQPVPLTAQPVMPPTQNLPPAAQPAQSPTGMLAPTAPLPTDYNDKTALLDKNQRAALAGKPSEARPIAASPVAASPVVASPVTASPAGALPSTTPAPPPPSTSISTMSRMQSSAAQSERERLRLEVEKLLERTVKMKGSDLHLASSAPPIVRRFGSLIRLEGEPFNFDKAQVLIKELLTQEQLTRFEKTNDLDFSYEVVGVGRFRANVMRQYRGIDLTFHVVPSEIQSPEQLGLPPVVRESIRTHQGLVLITGTAGQGKSTTISSLVDVINSERPVHIITIEDPIEFVHPLNKRAVVNQREVGRHTHSFANALRAALREDPDVIVVGEMRDLDTISLAITAAETGHLVMGTLMTSNAHQTVDRILESFPPSQQNHIRTMLSDSLRAVVSQRLLPQTDDMGMVLAAEIMVGTPAVSNLIRDKKTYQIPSVLQTNRHLGMKRMDDALLELVETGKISPQKGLEFALDKRAFEAAIGKR